MSEELTTLGNALALYTHVRSPRVRARLEEVIDEITEMIRTDRTFTPRAGAMGSVEATAVGR